MRERPNDDDPLVMLCTNLHVVSVTIDIQYFLSAESKAAQNYFVYY